MAVDDPSMFQASLPFRFTSTRSLLLRTPSKVRREGGEGREGRGGEGGREATLQRATA